jgi:ABC-type nitrate/sulfonate/bicarbonate transport system permease component
MPVAIVLLAFSLWETLARTGAISAFYFPAPTTILRTLLGLIVSGELWRQLGATLSRLFPGLLLGGVPGLLLGLAMGWSRPLRLALDPIIAALHPVPKIAVLPLLMVIFGIGETSKIVVIGVAAFFPMLINSMAGVRQVSPTYFEVAENYGAGRFKVLTRVVLPGSLPMILSGLRLALNLSLLLTIATEIVAGDTGLGAMIWLSWELLRVDVLYASLFVAAGLGIASNQLLQSAMRRLVPWQVERA